MAKPVGQALREARLERGIELTEVERVTKIRVKFLRAMEEDRWEELPAPAYARGFLQTYARYLDLDDEALVEQYRETIEPEEREAPIPSSVLRPGTLEPHRPIRPRVIALVGALAAVVLLGILVIGSLGGSSNGGGTHHKGKERTGSVTSTQAGGVTSTTSTSPASELSVEVRPTADVWVCLMDDRGRALVDGETLAAGEARGPFTALGFEVTFGNGSVEMTVDGQPAQIPPSASPLNYRITSSGVKQLASGAGPSCV
jgi:hypothetical protein